MNQPLSLIAAQRVERLLTLARLSVRTDEKQAIRYVQLARKLAARHRLALGKGRKHLFCPKCSLPWVAGYNLKVRLQSKTKRAEYVCGGCGAKRFFPYSKARHPEK